LPELPLEHRILHKAPPHQVHNSVGIQECPTQGIGNANGTSSGERWGCAGADQAHPGESTRHAEKPEIADDDEKVTRVSRMSNDSVWTIGYESVALENAGFPSEHSSEMTMAGDPNQATEGYEAHRSEEADR